MLRLSHTAILLLAALAWASCTKEDPVEPCDRHQQAGDDARAMTTATQAASMQCAAPGTGGRDHGHAIGDDGDDLSGTERTNRKRDP